jgi:prepilin-type processing-associated H-X9-DG protein
MTLAANSLAVPLGSYGYNANGVQFGLSPLGLGGYLTNPSDTNSIRPIRDSAIVAPADMIQLGDANLMWVPPPVLQAFCGTNGPTSYSGFARLDITSRDTTEAASFAASTAIIQNHQQRHRDQFNVGFGDGHIEHPVDAKLFQQAPANLSRWNNDHQPHADLLAR